MSRCRSALADGTAKVSSKSSRQCSLPSFLTYLLTANACNHLTWRGRGWRRHRRCKRWRTPCQGPVTGSKSSRSRSSRSSRICFFSGSCRSRFQRLRLHDFLRCCPFLWRQHSPCSAATPREGPLLGLFGCTRCSCFCCCCCCCWSWSLRHLRHLRPNVASTSASASASASAVALPFAFACVSASASLLLKLREA